MSCCDVLVSVVLTLGLIGILIKLWQLDMEKKK